MVCAFCSLSPSNSHSYPQLAEEGPLSLTTVPFCFWVGQRNIEGEPSPLQLGPGHARFCLGKAGPGEAGWLCCFCQLWGLGQGSGPPVVSLIQHEHSHWVLTVSTGCCREDSDKWEMVFDLKDLTIYSEGITYTKNCGTGKMWTECHMTIHLLFQ